MSHVRSMHEHALLVAMNVHFYRYFATMRLYPTFEDIANVNAGYVIAEGMDAVLFRRVNNKIGVCCHAEMGGVPTRKLDWKAIKSMAEFLFPKFKKLYYCLFRKQYFAMLRQNGFIREQNGLVGYDDIFYFPDYEAEEFDYQIGSSVCSLIGYKTVCD